MGAPLARLTRCAARLNKYVESVCLSEDLLEGTAEARDDCAAVQDRFSLEDDPRRLGLMNGDGPSFRIGGADETHPSRQVLVHFRGDLNAPISRRSDFDCKI